MTAHGTVRWATSAAVLFSAGVLFSTPPSLAGAAPQQPAAAVDASKLSKEKQTKLGLYVTAAQALSLRHI